MLRQNIHITFSMRSESEWERLTHNLGCVVGTQCMIFAFQRQMFKTTFIVHISIIYCYCYCCVTFATLLPFDTFASIQNRSRVVQHTIFWLFCLLTEHTIHWICIYCSTAECQTGVQFINFQIYIVLKHSTHVFCLFGVHFGFSFLFSCVVCFDFFVLNSHLCLEKESVE